MTMTATALIVDDEADLCRLMQMTLTRMGLKSDVAYDLATAYELLAKNYYNFCLTDMKLPDGDGLDLVKFINRQNWNMPVAMITAHGNMDIAIEALKLGAFDFVNKPLELPRLKKLVENALKVAQEDLDIEENSPNKEKSPAQKMLDERLIGNSEVMQKLKVTIHKLARSQAPVFLWGASGTGKEVVARLIHDLSPRREGNFVAVNCGAIPSELMESEFFGHKKGSFTGAITDKQGLFQQANGGTLFLDEVADLPLAMQVKLLRAIQEKTIRAVGDTKEIPVDIRILSATHKDLNKLVQAGSFRQDLFYRINVIELQLPTLNQRSEDVPMLAKHFLQLIADDWQFGEELALSKNALTALQNYEFEGNVRELRNLLERAITLADSNIIDSQHLKLKQTINQENPNTTTTKSKNSTTPPKKTSSVDYQASHTHFINNYIPTNPLKKTKKQISTPIREQEQSVQAESNTDLTRQLLEGLDTKTGLPLNGLEDFLQRQERVLLINALNHTKYNKTKTAQLLDMSLRSLRYRLDKLNIDVGE